MKPPQKDLYGNPIDSTSSSQSPEVDISFAFDKEEPSSSDVSNIYSETNSAGKLSNGKGKLISSKEEHVRHATNITKSNIWDIIFGTKRIAYGNKRGYTRRCSSYCSDITLSNFSNAALTSLVVVVAPIVQKNRLHNKVNSSELPSQTCISIFIFAIIVFAFFILCPGILQRRFVTWLSKAQLRMTPTRPKYPPRSTCDAK